MNEQTKKALKQAGHISQAIVDLNPDLEATTTCTFAAARILNFKGETDGVKYNLALMLFKDEEMLKMNTSYAICSPEDEYKEEVGEAIAMGRALRRQGRDGGMYGGVSPSMIAVFVQGSQQELFQYLAVKEEKDRIFQNIETYWNEELAELAEGLK